METEGILEGEEQEVQVQGEAQEEQGVQVQGEAQEEQAIHVQEETLRVQETHKDHGEVHVESQTQEGVHEEAPSQVCTQEVIPSLSSKRRERLEEEVGRSQALIVLPAKKPRRIMDKASTSRARVPQAKASKRVTLSQEQVSRMPRSNVEEEDTSVETATIIAMNLKLNEISTEDDKGYIWGNNVTFLIRCSSVSKASIFTNSRMLDFAYAYQLYKAMVHLKAPIIPNVVLRPMLFIQDVENPQSSILMFKSVPHFEHVFTHFFHCDTKECPDVYATLDMPHTHNLAKRRFLARCRFEPIDGHHFCYACSVFAKQDFDQGRLNRDIYETRFHFIPTLICLYNDDQKYILESERLNNEPTQMKKKSSCAEILTKARLIWETLGSPKSTLMKTTSKQQAESLVKFYTLLSGVVPRGHADRKEVITTFKAVRDRYFDYTNIIFRENEVFQSILGVCNAYHKGELSYESSHVSGKKKRDENKEMTVRMWRPLKTTPNKYVTIACEKLSKQEWFFGKKEKVLNMEDSVNGLVKEDACIEAISFLLEHKDISVEECKVDMDVIKQISASLTTKEKSWAHKWIRESCAGKLLPTAKRDIPERVRAYAQALEKEFHLKKSVENGEFLFETEAKSEGGKVVTCKGISTSNLLLSESSWEHPHLFLVDELELNDVKDFINKILFTTMARHPCTNIVIFTKEEEKDDTIFILQNNFSQQHGIKIYSGFYIPTRFKRELGVLVQQAFPYILLMLNRSSSPSLAHNINGRELRLFIEDEGHSTSTHWKNNFYTSKAKSGSVLLRLLENLCPNGWNVALYRMGYAFEDILRKGYNAVIVERDDVLQELELVAHLTLSYEKEKDTLESGDDYVEYIEEEILVETNNEEGEAQGPTLQGEDSHRFGASGSGSGHGDQESGDEDEDEDSNSDSNEDEDEESEDNEE